MLANLLLCQDGRIQKLLLPIPFFSESGPMSLIKVILAEQTFKHETIIAMTV